MTGSHILPTAIPSHLIVIFRDKIYEFRSFQEYRLNRGIIYGSLLYLEVSTSFKCTHTYACTHICTHAHTHTCTYAMHTHTHTHTPASYQQKSCLVEVSGGRGGLEVSHHSLQNWNNCLYICHGICIYTYILWVYIHM